MKIDEVKECSVIVSSERYLYWIETKTNGAAAALLKWYDHGAPKMRNYNLDDISNFLHASKLYACAKHALPYTKDMEKSQ